MSPVARIPADPPAPEIETNMLIQPRDSAPAFGFGIAASRPAHELLEARQESQILTAYALNPHLRAYDFKVTVCRGMATLSGNVGDDVSNRLAVQIALGVDGIKSVDSRIETVSNYGAPESPAKRRFGEIVDDASITSWVKSKMMSSRHAGGFSVKVETMRGKVNLSGTADSAEAKEAAGKLAANTQGVHAVSNELVVMAGRPYAPRARNVRGVKSVDSNSPTM